METSKNVWKIIAIAAFLLIFSGCQNSPLCTDKIGCITLAPGEPLTIGIERATVGNERFASQAVIEALNIAANRQPLINGHPIRFYIQNTTCSVADQNTTTGLLISQPDLVSTIGPTCRAGSDAYAKLVSDAGLTLLSPAVALAPDVLPGIYDLFPSSQALASALDMLLASATTIKNIDMLVWNAPIYIQFSNEFCGLWEKRGQKCRNILRINPDISDIANIPNQIIGAPANLVFILPFSSINLIPDFRDILNNRTAIFFDPELAVWDESQDTFSGRMVITYHPQPDAKKMGFSLYGEYPEISGLFAFDAYNILFRSMTESAQITPDGKMTLFRQKLRDSIDKMTDFYGLAGNYSCSGRTTCLIMEKFLDVRLPIH